jgi:hypothetical protein
MLGNAVKHLRQYADLLIKLKADLKNPMRDFESRVFSHEYRHNTRPGNSTIGIRLK